jgi:hypothetical protein
VLLLTPVEIAIAATITATTAALRLLPLIVAPFGALFALRLRLGRLRLCMRGLRLRLALLVAKVHAEIIAAVEIVAGIIEPGIVIATETLRILFFLAGAIVGQHTEIMVGELEIIFHVHAVAGELRITRHVPVLFQKLGGIAPRPVVDTVTAVAAPTVLPVGAPVIVPAAITPAGLTIVDQWWVLSFKVIPWGHPPRGAR